MRKQCKENVEKISAYIDEELESSLIGKLEAHLAECGICTRVFNLMKSGKRLIKQRFTKPEVPAALEQRIVASVRKEAGLRAPAVERIPFIKRMFAPHPAWAAVSLVLLVIAGVIHLRTTGVISPKGDLPTTIGSYVDDITHDAFLLERLPERRLDVESEDPYAAEPMMTHLAGFEVEIPNLAAAGYHMEGGRLWHTVARISALIVYEDDEGHSLSLFEISKDRIGMTGASSVDIDGKTFYIDDGYGYCGICWVQGKIAYGLVGKQPKDELLVIATTAMKQLDVHK